MIQLAAPDWNKVVHALAELQDADDYRVRDALLECKPASLQQELDLISSYCKKLDLTFTAQHLERMYAAISISNAVTKSGNASHYSPADFAKEMTILEDRFNDELRSRFFLTINVNRIECYRKPELFGELVSEKFPGSTIDIEEAGNCFALDRWTACVFHLMRALEKPLFAMAAALKITRPTENWGRIIEAIESAVHALEQIPNKDYPTKVQDIQFYSEASKEFRYFKNAWRNHVMHGNLVFSEEDAERVMDHVRDFMKQISKRLSEEM
jgi:hypothetical protein